eukprot:4325757-Amphidinium_carterae.1
MSSCLWPKSLVLKALRVMCDFAVHLGQDVQARPLAEEQQQEQHQQSSSSYDDDSWTIVCGALRVDVEDLRRKHDRLAQKEDPTECPPRPWHTFMLRASLHKAKSSIRR